MYVMLCGLRSLINKVIIVTPFLYIIHSKQFHSQRTTYSFVEYDMPKTLPINWAIGNCINFTLPHEIDITATINSFQLFASNNIFVSGTLPNNGWFEASSYENIILANIMYPGNIQYELRPSKIHRSIDESMETYMMRQVNVLEEYYVKDLDNDIQIGRARRSKASSSSSSLKLSSSLNSIIAGETMDVSVTSSRHHHIPSLIDNILQLKLLILYTKEAVIVAGSETSLLSTITLAIGNFNTALRNSLIDVNVVYVAERIKEYDTYQEPTADLSTILSQMNSGDDIISTSIRRAAFRAHAVQLIVAGNSGSGSTDSSSSCGMSQYDFNGDTNGMSVSTYGCMGGYFSLAHEIGHNIGLHHDLKTHSSRGINHGYCWDDENDSDATPNTTCKRSIMATAKCTTASGRTSCDRVPYFSNPDVIILSSSNNNGVSSDGIDNRKRQQVLVTAGVAIGESAHCNNAQHFRSNIEYFISLSNTPSSTTTTDDDNSGNNDGINNSSISPTVRPSHHFSLPTLLPVSIQPSYTPTKVPHVVTTTTKIPTKHPSFKPTTPAKVIVVTTIKPSSSSLPPSLSPSIAATPSYVPSVVSETIVDDTNDDDTNNHDIDNNAEPSSSLPTVMPTVKQKLSPPTSSLPSKVPHRAKRSPTISPSSLSISPTTMKPSYDTSVDDHTNYGNDDAYLPPSHSTFTPTTAPTTATVTITPTLIPVNDDASLLWSLPTYTPTLEYDNNYHNNEQLPSSSDFETFMPTSYNISNSNNDDNTASFLLLFGSGKDIVGEVATVGIALLVLFLIIYGMYTLNKSRQQQRAYAANNDNDNDESEGAATNNSTNNSGGNMELHFVINNGDNSSSAHNYNMLNTITPQSQIRSKLQTTTLPQSPSSSALSYVNSIMKTSSSSSSTNGNNKNNNSTSTTSAPVEYKRLVTQEESEELDDFYKDINNDEDD